MITTDRYGSEHTDMDYRTEAHTIMASAAWNPMPRFSFTANASYTMGRGNITDLEFGHLPAFFQQDLKIWMDTTSVNPNMPHLYDTFYLNDMSSYSNLDFKDMEIEIGASYALTPKVGLGLKYFYSDVEDEEEYVYGSQDVTVQSLMGFITYHF